jgi:predicted MFS family arabinose efflux permease
VLKFIFTHKKYSLLLTASLISQFGSFFTYMLVIVLTYQKTHSLIHTMGVTLCSALGSLLTGLIAGIYVDKFKASTIMIITDSLSAIVLFVLFFLPFMPFSYYVCVFIIAVLASFNGPAFNKLQVTIVEQDFILESNAIRQVMRELIKIVAPGTAAFVLSLLPNSLRSLGFIFDGASYLIAMIMVLLVFFNVKFERENTKGIRESALKSFKKSWIEGWEPFKNPVILNILIMFFIITAGIAGFDVIMSAHLLSKHIPIIYLGYIIVRASLFHPCYLQN